MSNPRGGAAAAAAAASTLLRPDDVTRLGCAAANAAGQAVCRDVLQLSFADATGAFVAPSARAAALAHFGGDAASAAAAFAAAAALFERALRRLAAHGGDESEAAAALTALGLEAAVAADVAGAARRGRAALLAVSEAAAPRNPGVASVRWRVDVTISSSALNRVMRPSVLMELALTDGSVERFDVPLESFHALRYSCAKVLSEMAAVESHPVLLIQ